MYTTPPDEEEQDQPQTTHQIQRRNNSANTRARRSRYYNDEHPEIPKVRRASLRLDEAEPQTSAATKVVRPEKKVASAVRPTRIPSPPPEPEPFDEDMEDDETPLSRTSPKIMVAPQRRRPPVYEPPPPAPNRSRKLHKRTQAPPRGLLFKLANNRTFILVASTTLVLLILIPILLNIVMHDPSRPVGYTPTSGGKTGISNAPSSGIQPADPHTIIITPANTDHPAPPVMATAAYLIDADTGATLYAQNPFMHLPILSTTKLMTATLALEHGKLDQQITVSNAIDRDLQKLSADSSLMHIKKGETYTLQDLLYGLMLMSGNDAAVAIADSVAGSVPKFVDMMNERAKQLGLNDTHFMNPHGLLEQGHYSSAHDLALLGKYALGNPTLLKISGTKQYHIAKTAQHDERFMVNGNQFLWWYPGVNGGKPGWDGQQNFVQVISCVRNNRHLIGVTIHTSDWWTDMRNLMNWGFNSYTWVSPHDLDTPDHPIPYDVDWNYFEKDKKENTIATPDKGRYYIYTGFSINGLIQGYFDKNGALKKFGFPTGLPQVDADTMLSQRFEHGTVQCDLTTKQCVLK